MTLRLLATARPGGVLAATAAACALAVLAGTGAATADLGLTTPPPLLPTTSPSPVHPRPEPDWWMLGGVKMGPLPGPAIAVNDQPSHSGGDWYPDGPGSVNPAARGNFILRLDAGRYLIWVPGVQPEGAVTATSTSSDRRCTVGDVTDSPGWYSGVDVTVSCMDTAGHWAGATFTVRL